MWKESTEGKILSCLEGWPNLPISSQTSEERGMKQKLAVKFNSKRVWTVASLPCLSWVTLKPWQGSNSDNDWRGQFLNLGSSFQLQQQHVAMAEDEGDGRVQGEEEIENGISRVNNASEKIDGMQIRAPCMCVHLGTLMDCKNLRISSPWMVLSSYTFPSIMLSTGGRHSRS